MNQKTQSRDIKYYVKISNQWFNTNSDNNLLSCYGGKGLALLIKMLQQLSARGRYDLTSFHIQEWFQYSNHKSLKHVFALLRQFQDDGVFAFDGGYNFTNVYRGLIKFQPTTISMPENEFFLLFDYEVDRILNHSGKVDQYKLLSLFACLKYHYHTVACLCSPPLEVLSHETQLSENTIQSYLDVLVELGLIFYANPGTRLYLDGEVKTCNNIYTMGYEGNKEILEQEVARVQQELATQEKDKQLKVINSEMGNQKKSIKMKLYWLPIRLERGTITQEEYSVQLNTLQAQYDQLVEKQKTIL